jgi:hypothetical protein
MVGVVSSFSRLPFRIGNRGLVAVGPEGRRVVEADVDLLVAEPGVRASRSYESHHCIGVGVSASGRWVVFRCIVGPLDDLVDEYRLVDTLPL